MSTELKILIPGTDQYIVPGNIVKLGRFNTDRWQVNYDWFEFDGNRPMCGWYLINIETHQIKPLLKPDLIDIYVVDF